ncbi:IgG-binding virulence factor TspB family protein [Neisseria sp. RH3002v2f]|uniref:IgG-binding virulence factor TspB family protein n=1 Tax=Neisseria sp. RH3002v2f TaxID=1871108 RepID=UPI00166082FA|nr:IgG-binding virulence factor TspB family protein [Neisseria sp. RH3002v2f]
MIYSFEANANAVKISETVSVETGQGAKIHKFVPKSSNTYSSDLTKAVDLTHIPTGAKARINAKITASVSRAGVLAGVGALVRQGAKLGTRAVPYVGTALLAYDIYKELNPELEKAGFRYSEDIGDYVKYYDNALCKGRFRSEPGYFSCVGVDSSELLALSQGGQRAKETQDLLVRRVQSDLERIADVLGKDYGEPNRFKIIDYCFYNGDISVSCSFGDLLLRYGLQHKIKKSEPDPNSFNDLIAKKVDENPDKFIKLTNFPGYKEDVEVAPGTKLNIGPVTDKSGNPVQVLVSFGRDSQGKTTADVQVTPRPDLTPGSVEAPNVRPSPDTSPATNPSNNPNPNEQPGTRPNPEPDLDTNPEPNLKPGTSPGSPVIPGTSPANGRDGKDGKDGQDGKDGGFLCRYFPTILACQEMGKPTDGMFDDITIPQVTDDKTWSSDDFLPSNGVCPQPKTFHVFGKRYEASYEPLCVFAEKIRFAVLLAFIIMSAFVVFGSLRKE